MGVVALYDKPQVLPLPDMYGKNLTFKTGGVDGCDCAEILSLIENVKIDTNEAYKMFENKEDRVIKVAIENQMFLNEDYNRLVYKLYCFRSAQIEII